MARKAEQPRQFDVDVRLTCIGGWNAAGLVHSTYERVLQGLVEVISPTHLYHGIAGKDLYPTVEQFELLQQGQPVTLGTSQWA